MRSISLIIFTFILLLSCSIPDYSDENQLIYTYESEEGNKLNILLPDKVLYSSDNVPLRLKLSYSKFYTAELPVWNDLKDSMDIIKVTELSGPLELNGNIEREIELTINNLLPGDYLINPITINFYSDEVIADKVMTDYIPLEIQTSMLEGEEKLIDDFSEIKTVGFSSNALIVIFLIVVSLATVILIIILKNKRKRRQDKTVYFTYADKIKNLTMDNPRDLYINLSTILKEFLDSSMFLSVQSQTIEEFIQSSRFSPLLSDQKKKELYAFLRRAERSIFGKYIPDNEEMKKEIRFSIEFIKYVEEIITMEAANDI